MLLNTHLYYSIICFYKGTTLGGKNPFPYILILKNYDFPSHVSTFLHIAFLPVAVEIMKVALSDLIFLLPHFQGRSPQDPIQSLCPQLPGVGFHPTLWTVFLLLKIRSFWPSANYFVVSNCQINLFHISTMYSSVPFYPSVRSDVTHYSRRTSC